MDIDNLEASPELDALVAEKVMGWRRAMMIIGDPYYPPNLPPEGNILGHVIPDYSTDIAAAWEVVEKLRDGKVWPIAIVLLDVSGEWSVYFDDQASVNRSLPLAICRAALKTVKE